MRGVINGTAGRMMEGWVKFSIETSFPFPARTAQPRISLPLLRGGSSAVSASLLGLRQQTQGRGWGRKEN